MQAIILAAGRGSRMKDLTIDTPKPMIKVGGKTLLEHKLDLLPGTITDIIIVIGHHAEAITEYLGDAYAGRKVTYVTQEVLDGTAGAVWLCKPHLRGDFMVISGDDIYSKEDLEKMSKTPWSMLGIAADDVNGTGKMILDEAGRVSQILERDDHAGGPGIINAGMYTLDMRLFEYPMVRINPTGTEFGLPRSIVATGIRPTFVQASKWTQMTCPEDVASAEKALMAA